MDTSALPFNIKIFQPTPARLQRLRPVRVLDIYDGATNNLHEDGLFSPVIFGRVGDDSRDVNFSYIELNTQIFHPLLYKNIVMLRAFYKEIIHGTGYAVWDEKEKDFVISNELEGQTGFAFFLTHWKDIKFKEGKSARRNERIMLIEKFKDIALTDKVLVLPAGLRDIEEGPDGRPTRDPINDLYVRLVGVGNSLRNSKDQLDPVTNQPRLVAQLTFNEIFDYLADIISGKGGFIQKKWASRRIHHGTANVITSMDPTTASLGSSKSVDINTTFVGLYQMTKAIEPITLNLLRNGVLSKVFNGSDLPATLVDKKTLTAVQVKVSGKEFDRWNTEDGLVKVLTSLKDNPNRNLPVMVGDNYLALVYKGANGTFKIIHDKNEVPEELMSSGTVTPITYFELVYLSGYSEWDKYPGMVTRYPVAGIDSTYVCNVHMRTTITSEERRELGDDWQPLEGDEYLAVEFPDGSEAFFDSLSVHPSKLKGLGGDFDGDRCNFNAFFTKEAIAEIRSALGKKNSYIRPNGGFRASISSDVVDLVLHNMTGD